MRYPLVSVGVVLLLVACGDSSSSGGGGNTGPGGGGSGATSAGGSGGGGGDGGSGATGGGGGIPGNYDCTASVGDPPDLRLTEIVQVNEPTQAKSPPGQSGLLFVSEKAGRIQIVENGVLRPQPFLDISDLVINNSELGLLGFAFHPNYAENGRFFVHYSDVSNQDSVIAEYVRSDPYTASPTAVAEVLRHYTDESNHNGGAVEFGADGYLYISLGDGGAQGDPGCDALNPENLLGKISRIDVDAAGYPAAPGNPDGNKQYHIGMRNPWRITFDPCDGTLYIGDVGQDEIEEVSVAEADAGPLNFGWPVKEGTQPYADSCGFPAENLVDPIAEYTHGGGGICGPNAGSISGGYVYRGANIQGLRGWYIYGDFCTGNIYRLKYENGAVTGAVVDAGFSLPAVSAFGQDGYGEMYALELDGRVYRIDAE